MSLTQNQFSQAPVQGQLDLMLSPNTIAAVIDPLSAGGLISGQAVKRSDVSGKLPTVIECADDSDDVFGFINYNLKNASFKAGSELEISFYRGNVMWMTAGAAIAANGKVMIVIASNKVITATAGNTIVGRALDKASADGDLIRVLIDLPGALA